MITNQQLSTILKKSASVIFIYDNMLEGEADKKGGDYRFDDTTLLTIVNQTFSKVVGEPINLSRKEADAILDIIDRQN